MKKIFYGIIALALVAGMSACGKGEKSTATPDSLVDKATSDSISTSYGTMVGGYMLREITEYSKTLDHPYDKAQFVAGLKSVIGSELTEEYMAGVNAGMSVAHDINSMIEKGVQIDRKALLACLVKAFEADSADVKATDKATRTYDELMTVVNKAARERQTKQATSTPEASQNLMTARTFIEKQRKDDPEIQESPSGLYYKVTNPGEGPKVGPKDSARVKFYATRLDGKLIDGSEGTEMTPANGLLPALAEGLALLGKGGKATLYVPADLGYGAAGIPDLLGPNEMTIYMIEILDITPAE